MSKIIGNTATTSYPNPDWDQTDNSKADYIKNKPIKTTRISSSSTDEEYPTALAVYTALQGTSPGGGGGSSYAEDIHIDDDGEYFISDNVEGALHEIGRSLLDKNKYIVDITRTGAIYSTSQILSSMNQIYNDTHDSVVYIKESSLLIPAQKEKKAGVLIVSCHIMTDTGDILYKEIVYNILNQTVAVNEINKGGYNAIGISIEDENNFFVTTNVEQALQEVGEILNEKQTKTINSSVVSGYFDSNTIEGALQEIAEALNGINTALGDGVLEI